MLFPGAIYVIMSTSWLLIMVICIVLAFIVGSSVRYTAEFIVERTNAWQTHRGGAKDSKRWWFNLNAWAGAAMIVSFVIFIYTVTGPYLSFVKYLKGI